MRISDWSSDVCSSDRSCAERNQHRSWPFRPYRGRHGQSARGVAELCLSASAVDPGNAADHLSLFHYNGRSRPSGVTAHCTDRRRHDRYRSEEHTSELQSLMRISYAVFCLKTKKHTTK